MDVISLAPACCVCIRRTCMGQINNDMKRTLVTAFALLAILAMLPATGANAQEVDALPQVVQPEPLIEFDSEGEFTFEVKEATPEEVAAGKAAADSGNPPSIQAVSISAADGTSDYAISASYSASQVCLFASNLRITLTATTGGVTEFSRTINSDVGYLGSYSGTWTVYSGPSKSYTFKITARSTGGAGCDNTQSATNGGSTRSLRPPTNVAASADGSDQNVTLTWSRGSNITNTSALYHAVYKNGQLYSYQPYASTSYTFTTTPNSTDTYGVASYFPGWSSGTNPAQLSSRVNRDATTVPFIAPANVSATKLTTVRSIDLSWSNTSDYASSSYIYRDGAIVASVPKTTTSYSDTLIVPGDEYDYCISNYRGVTESNQGCAPEPGQSFFVRADDGTKTNNVRVEWPLTPNELSNVSNIQILRNGEELDVKSPSSTTYTDLLAEAGSINRYDVVLRDASNNVVLTDFDGGFVPANGEIKGSVKSEGVSSGGVRDVLVSATPDGDSYKYSISLNGTDNHVRIGHRPSLSLAANYTAEAWVKPAAIRAQTIIAKGASPNGGAFGLAMNADGTVTWYARGGSASVSSAAALPIDTWSHIAVVQDERISQLRLLINGQLSATAALSGDDVSNFLPLTLGANSNGSSPFSGQLDEVRLWSTALTDSTVEAEMSNIVVSDAEGLISYWRFSTGTGDTAGDIAVGGGNHGQFVGNVAWSPDEPPVSHRALTDNRGQGEFSIIGLPYRSSSSGTLYSVVPTKENHAFDPAERFERLTPSSHLIDDSNFTDTTSVSVSGQILFAGTSCPVDSVEMRIDDIPNGLTDENGLFAIGGIERGQHTILPVFREHTFTPASANINFTGDVTGVEFQDATVRTLDGVVAGGECRADIGRARVTVTALNGCLTKEIVTSDLAYTLELPAMRYNVSVEMLDDPTIQFAARTIDLTDADSTLDFIYYAPPQVVITGFPESSCANPIIEQSRVYEVLATVTEQYGSRSCPAEIGEVQIFDEISDGVAPSTVELDSLGVIRYDLQAGAPNIVGGGPNPYQKRIAFAASTPGGDLTEDQLVIVEGNRPREQTFTTVSPQIPLLILRDPPGDLSYSYKEQSTSSCYAASLSLLADASVGIFSKVRAGTKFETEFFGVSFETKVWGELSSSLEVGARALNQTEREVCVTTSNRYSTSGNQDVTGTEGDVFIGSALNLVYAITDVLDVDEDSPSCPVSVTQEIVYDNDGFATKYHYTESHIRNTVIPDLELNRELASDAKKKQEFDDQIEVWNQTLALNERLKQTAVNMGNDYNLSFSANAPLEQSTEWRVTDRDHIEFNLYVNSEVALEAGVEIGGVGASGGVRVRASLDVGTSETTTTTTTNKTGFFLADDDAGDAFSVDVKRDYVYGTPVFSLVSGVSSYPHEEGTLPRDGVELTLAPATQTLADPAGTAEVILSLGNTGQNFETRNYELAFLQESNPYAAEVTIGGSPVQGPIPYSLGDSESRQVTLRLKRSPASTVYDYDNLQLVLRSPGDSQFADTASFSVHFTSPCTPLTLVEPANGWIVNQSNHDSLRVYFKDYNKVNLNQMRLEISPAGRNAWSAVRTLSPGDIPDNEAVLIWKTNNTIDKAYDFRVAAECTVDNAVATSYSVPTTGIIDRVSPKIFGTPEPASGILSGGSDIKATFSEALDCGTATASAVSLKNAATGASIPAQLQCAERTVIVEPQSDLTQFENTSLQVTLKDIRDVNGNKMDKPETWNFTVNRNAVYWASARVSGNTYQGEATQIDARLVNSGQDAVTWSLTQLPTWVTPSETRGTLEAGSSRTVSFATNTTLLPGQYSGKVVASMDSGAEPLTLDLMVSCPAPDWTVNAASFSHNMSVTAGFYLQNVPFSDSNDRVAAFVNGEVRGVSTVQKVVPQDEYAAFLTVYSNATTGETVSFRLYDASECRERLVAETVQFQSDDVVGSAEELQPLTVTGATLQSISLVKGWTWISFGVEAANMSAKAVLSQLKATDGDVIKSQTKFSQYVSGQGWIGSLDSIATGVTYKILSDKSATLPFVGEPVDVNDHPIAVKPGWNWVGYLPDNSLGINDALASLDASASTDDIIKSQFAFATFSNGDWTGSLGTLVPGDGYLLRSSQTGSLVYPGASGVEASAVTTILARAMADGAPPEWTVNAAQYEKSMTITASLILENGQSTNGESLIAAFVGNEIRGVTKPVYVLDKWVYFLTVYGNTDGETVTFKAYDADRDEVSGIVETTPFESEGAIGTPRETKQMTSTTAVGVEDENGVPLETTLEQNYPNPFAGRTSIPYALDEALDVRIDLYDALGRHVATVVDAKQAAGRYAVSFDTNTLASGLYLYRMRAGEKTITKTMTIVR